MFFFLLLLFLPLFLHDPPQSLLCRTFRKVSAGGVVAACLTVIVSISDGRFPSSFPPPSAIKGSGERREAPRMSLGRTCRCSRLVVAAHPHPPSVKKSCRGCCGRNRRRGDVVERRCRGGGRVAAEKCIAENGRNNSGGEGAAGGRRRQRRSSGGPWGQTETPVCTATVLLVGGSFSFPHCFGVG